MLIKSQTEKEAIQKFINNIGFIPSNYMVLIVEAAPGLILSIIAGIVPILVNTITKFEAYDFESDMID